jgi:hypothetical protein
MPPPRGTEMPPPQHVELGTIALLLRFRRALVLPVFDLHRTSLSRLFPKEDDDSLCWKLITSKSSVATDTVVSLRAKMTFLASGTF